MTPEQRAYLESTSKTYDSERSRAEAAVLAALDKAEGERDDVTQGLLDMLRRAQLAEGENARLRAIIQRGVNWLDGKGTKVGGLYSFDVQFFDLALDDLRAAVASPTQPAPAGEVNPKCHHGAESGDWCKKCQRYISWANL